MSVRRAEVLLAAVIIARSTSFVFNKIGLGTMSAFNMLAVRFLLAFVLLAALFGKKLIKGLNRRAIAGGALVGFLFFLVMSCEMLALKTVNAGTVSLLENLAIIIVPLLESALHRRAPSAMSLLCAAIAVGGMALLTLEGGSFRLAEKGCPMTAEIRALDAIWESHYNMMVLHGDEDYDWTRKCDPAVKQDFTYVCFDAAGKPNAYTTFRLANEPDGRNLVCSRFCFADKGGFDELMRLYKSLSSDHRFVKFSTPANPAMQYFMPEWSLGAVSWSVQSAGMVRAVNVKSVLEKARYIGSGSVCVVVQDSQIPQNNDTFTVAFADGRAVSVARGGEADVVMTAPTFSALIAGVWDFAEARGALPGLEVKRENPCLNQVFFRKPLMIADYF